MNSSSKKPATARETDQRVSIVAGCLIEKDGRYLLVQENIPHAYGLWNLPAGRVDKGEEIEEAAIREAKEETGFEVSIVSKIGVFHNNAFEPVKHSFHAEITGGELSVDTDEQLDVKWLSYEDIVALNEQNKLRNPWIMESISIVQERQAS